MPAVPALPDLDLALLENLLRLHILQQGTIPLLMALLDLPDHAELGRQFREALRLGGLGKALVHIRPLVVLPVRGGGQVLGGGADAVQLLEPWYDFELEIPQDQVGRALNDIQKMSGKFDTPENLATSTIIKGRAPVSEMISYSENVRNYTHGQGRLQTIFAGYYPCHNKDEIIENIPKQFLNKIEREFEIRNKTKQNFSKLGLLRGRKSHKNSYYIIGYNEGEVIYKTIKFIHQGNNALFGVSEESDGTLKMLDLFDILLDKDNDRVYVVDELDLFLHPSISYKFISKFLELAQNKNIQLIVTSHETKLLDFNLLRRDEVWFTIKQSDGESNLVNLSKFAPRSDKKLEKAYFDGDFDIIPEQNLHHSNH